LLYDLTPVEFVTMVISVVMAVLGMAWIGMLLIQDQMNRHWRLHRERPAQAY
jgi:hypothetical protein